MVTLCFFCSNLDDTHLDGLITSVEKNCSLAFLDVDNNFLNPQLLLKLKEVLKSNSLKYNSQSQPSFQFEPIPCNLPASIPQKNDHVQVTLVQNKKIGDKENPSKVNPFCKGKKPAANTQKLTKEEIPHQKR